MAEPAPSSEWRLYEACMVYVVPPAGKLEPRLLWQYPKDFDAAWRSQLPLFCFPYAPASAAAFKKQLFMMRFTNELGQVVYGYCLQNEPATPASDAVLICLVSRLPWFDFFHTALKSTNAAYLKSKRDVNVLEACLQQLSKALRHTDLNRPKGNELLLKLPGNIQATLRVPDGEHNPLMSEMQTVGTLARCLSWSNLKQLLASIMAERRVMITSDDLGRLAKGCFGCDLALFPLHWQQVFIPILPNHLLDYCSAPVPYIVGVHKSLMPSVAERAMEDHVWVDMDSDTLTTPFNDADILPSELTAGLKEAAKRVRSLGQHAAERAPAVRDFCNLLTRVLVEVFAGYKPHIINMDRLISYDRDALLASKPKHYAPLITTITQTQMFQQLIEAVAAASESVDEGRSDGYFTEADNCRLFDVLVKRYLRLSGDASQMPTTKKERLISHLKRIKTKVKGDKDLSKGNRTGPPRSLEQRGRVQSVVAISTTAKPARKARPRSIRLQPSRAPPRPPPPHKAKEPVDTSALLREASSERYANMSRRLADLGQIADMTQAKQTLRNMAAELHADDHVPRSQARSVPGEVKSSTGGSQAQDDAFGANGNSSSNPFLSVKALATSPMDSPFHRSQTTTATRGSRSESNPLRATSHHNSSFNRHSLVLPLRRAASADADDNLRSSNSSGTLASKRTSWSASEDELSLAETDDGLELDLSMRSPSADNADLVVASAAATTTVSVPPLSGNSRQRLSPALEVLTPIASRGHSRNNSRDETSDDQHDKHDKHANPERLERALAQVSEDGDDSNNNVNSDIDNDHAPDKPGLASTRSSNITIDITVNDSKGSPGFLRRKESSVDVNARFVPSRDSADLDEVTPQDKQETLQ
eukprot:TRINITY_DN12435_c0_g2_i1.p1 TRINITY_DN12435_c0_g2~~TRINITY_DN12435_c0_g2_i1.p1  ORF type:complete len:875 (+),score=216.20 TRINITY_DN12435_c0_g2_i1:1786-4410(+)